MALVLTTFACVKRPRERSSSSESGLQAVSHNPGSPTAQTPPQPTTLTQTKAANFHREANQRINLNNASARELEELPGIGKTLAARIVEHREKYGPFRRPEHLIMVRGFGDRRVRALRDMITVE